MTLESAVKAYVEHIKVSYGVMIECKNRNLLIVAFLLGGLSSSVLAAEWFLMAREGGCAPLSSLARKGPEFRGLQTPYQLIDKMHAAGHQVDVKEHASPNGPMVEVHVPAKDIAVMVVTAEFCKTP
jgi:hypothetical protein